MILLVFKGLLGDLTMILSGFFGILVDLQHSDLLETTQF